MKKIISRSVTTMLIAATLVSSAFSQDLAVNTKKIVSQSETKVAPGETRYINDVNSKVLKSFRKLFGEKPDAKWSKSDNDFVASFKENKMTTYVYFSNNGTINYTVKHYFEDQLPENVRHTVRSNFYDYSITNVSEIHKDNVAWFFVKVQDKASIKTIRVIGEEWEVVEDITKQ